MRTPCPFCRKVDCPNWRKFENVPRDTILWTIAIIVIIASMGTLSS